MKILYINCRQYDYTTATLIEGLTELGHHVRCSEASNYGQALPDAEILPFAESADLIIVGSNAGVRPHLLHDVQNPRKVFVDGSDAATYETGPTVRYKAVFKRELCRADQDALADHIHPFPFAAEKRYFTADFPKDILLSFVATMHTNPLRNSIHVRLQNRKNPAIVSGGTGERTYSVRTPQPLPVETPAYRQFLARSLISVSAPGMGYDCARYWEIVAARAMLLTYAPDVMIPHPFVDGESCVTFETMDELDSKLDFYLNRLDLVQQIAARGYEHLLRHHTTARRAEQFLATALAEVERPDYCHRFFHEELRAFEAICQGTGLEISPDGLKTMPHCVALTPLDAQGQPLGHHLPQLPTACLDFLVSRHHLPLFADPASVLTEWRRIVRPGGRIGLAVPDHSMVDTFAVQPAAHSHFTPQTLSELVNRAGGLVIEHISHSRSGQTLNAVLRVESNA